MTPRRLLLVLVAALLGVAAGPVAAGPAIAASGYCPRGTGVTVVVDNGTLGGGTSVRCDPNGANTAGSTVVARAGYPLTYVQRQPGFVCRVAGAPASASCVGTPPTNAYWGLVWSDGRSGTWSYASVGIGSLKVPAGGFIGWRFQGGTRTDPGTAPTSPKPTSKPSPKPTPSRTPTPSTKPAPRPSAPPSTAAGSAGAAPTASGQARQEHSGPATGKASAKATARAQRTAQQQARHQSRQQARQQARKQARQRAGQKAAKQPAHRDAGRTQAAEASPGGTATPSGSATADPDTDLVAGERAAGSGGGPLLPLVAGGLTLVLLATVGRLAWVRRRG